MRMGTRLTSPVAAALGIMERYHKDIEARLLSSGIKEDLVRRMTTDLFSKDDIYFSLNKEYEWIEEKFSEFCRKHRLHSEIAQRFASLRLYRHQAEAIRCILNEHTTIIATGTGSGKTESFLIPLVHHCLMQRDQRVQGVKALILYPMNALANDQLERVIRMVYGTGIRVGCFVGSTPERIEGEEEEKRYGLGREEMLENPPDILITNYIMLDRLITMPKYRPLLLQSRDSLRYVVVDEVHYFSGIRGANLSLLLRRLHTLCKRPPIHIGASGTLRQSGGFYAEQAMEQIEEFVSLLFGPEAVKKGVKLIEPSFQPGQDEQPCDALPSVEHVPNTLFSADKSSTQGHELARLLFGEEQLKAYERSYSGNTALENPIYHLLKKSPFVREIRNVLEERACVFREWVQVFERLYERKPADPRSVVEAYWNLIDYINEDLRDVKPSVPLLLDYRVHLILSDMDGNVSRCVLCGHYHDSRCIYCLHCHGMLFPVRKNQPDYCIAYLANGALYAQDPAGNAVAVRVFVRPFEGMEVDGERECAVEITQDSEGKLIYRLCAKTEKTHTLFILPEPERQELALPLRIGDTSMYWYAALKVIEAVVSDQETSVTNRILGFVDAREKASKYRVRLHDELASYVLSLLARSVWTECKPLPEAFEELQNEINSWQEGEEPDELAFVQEMPFWFCRMLTYGENGAAGWRLVLNEEYELDDDEQVLLEQVFLSERAIDRDSFHTFEAGNIKYFYVERYRCEMRYGVGMSGSDERGYDIISLGERGQRYQELIARYGEKKLQAMLSELVARGLLVLKQTPKGTTYYQLSPEAVCIEPHSGSDGGRHVRNWEEWFVQVQCHTGELSTQERERIERTFKQGQRKQALICTPTMEMGVDINDLFCVMMLGFPPSPANYAQRAGRAGRGQKRQALVIVLASLNDTHDRYYYLAPAQMIEGEITPPSFSLRNVALLRAHSYAHILAGTETKELYEKLYQLSDYVQVFAVNDELKLQEVLDKDAYQEFIEDLERDCRNIVRKVGNGRGTITLEKLYREGIFPDYGFRNDDIVLYDRKETQSEEERKLTSREPEQAVTQLVPGSILFCKGIVVRIDKQQKYTTEQDVKGEPFRKYFALSADSSLPVELERRRDPEQMYKVSRLIRLGLPLEHLPQRGPKYCKVYYVPKGTLYFINEMQRKRDEFVLHTDENNQQFRFGTTIEREGLLIRFAASLLSPAMKENFLAVLLRGIPDYFNLDDADLRLVQSVDPADEEEMYESAFLYGNDKSGLVPFERIFENWEAFLSRHLQVLHDCKCQQKGCYLCLLSPRSTLLNTQVSPEVAIEFLKAYLGQERLKPYLPPLQDALQPVELVITANMQNGGWQFEIYDKRDNTSSSRFVEKTSDQNTAFYAGLTALLAEKRAEGATSAQIRTKISYIVKQLKGENKVNTGKRAFTYFELEKALWPIWKVEEV